MPWSDLALLIGLILTFALDLWFIIRQHTPK